MTDSTPDPPSSGQEPFVTIPLSAIRKARGRLSGTQYDLWLYLYELDPYGRRWVEVPPPDQLAKTLKCNPRTVERSVSYLRDCELFNFEVKRWKALNIRAREHFSKYSFGKEIQKLDQNVGNWTKRSKNGQKDPNPDPEPALGKASGNGNVPNNKKRSFKTTKQPTHHPVLENEQEGIGTTSALLQQIQAAGIKPNKTIRKVIGELEGKLGAAAAARAVENALSAVVEQREQGNLRNPGGMLIAGLREGYTANQAKQQAKDRERDTSSPLPDFRAVEWTIDRALLNRDRGFVLARLQQLWLDGWHDQVEALLQLRQDWGVCVTQEGIRDAGSGFEQQ